MRAAHTVWVVAAGEAKSQALSRAFSGAQPQEVPVAGLLDGHRPARRTTWWLDEAAAALLPHH